MAEETRKIEGRLDGMHSGLTARGQAAETILWGVAHVFKPPKELLEDIKRANIVTLELPPGAITRRKKQTSREMLAFWDGVLGELESSNKRFWAVDSNRILRNMRKAILRRIEPEDNSRNIFLNDMGDLPARLEGLVSPDKVQELAEAVDQDLIAFINAGMPVEKAGEPEKEARIFIAKPFPASVKRVCNHVRMRMKNRLPEEELYRDAATVFALEYVISLLMSHIDKTQAREMVHRLQNFCRLTEKRRVVHVHVGGYEHNKNLAELLTPIPRERYKVTEKKDPRFPVDGLSSFEFFGRIPLRTRIGLVHAEKNGIAINADEANRVFDSIAGHKDMERLLTYLKLEVRTGIWLTERGGSDYCQTFKSMLIGHLASKMPPESLAEIEKRCAPAKYSSKPGREGFLRVRRDAPGSDVLETFLGYLREKGFKPGPETLQYLKKGRENRCI